MISHPTAEILLRNANGDRAMARQMLLDEVLEEAGREARLYNLSINCLKDLLARSKHHRCRNDGSNCLCECHDL